MVGDFIESVHAKNSGRTIILGLLGPHLAGPADDDGWFAADFVMAHHIYSDIGGEQIWLSSVDLVKEAEVRPYLWGFPKENRFVIFTEDKKSFLPTLQSRATDFNIQRYFGEIGCKYDCG